MTDVPDQAPQPVVDAWTAGLLATKLYVPQTQPGTVVRQRLLDSLDAGLAHRLTLVSAPAGFGKTTLLADWIRRSRLLSAWLSLDAADNDPTRFWRHAIAALDTIRSGIAGRIAPLLGPPTPSTFDGVVTAIVNELADSPTKDDAVIVLDDYHLIQSEQVHASMLFLLAHLPPTLHLILACRADPLLPLAGLRARGQLAELRAAELRFTPPEAVAVLRVDLGPSQALSEELVTTLAVRTEGWVDGLRLAALSLRGRRDVEGFVASFSGSHRFILDYLTEEVLERQPAPVRQFLLETSVLDRLSGDLCDAVTGGAQGQQMLEAIERANLFLVPLDDVRGWWRYHHLFADLLRAQLQRHQPERVSALHLTAATWCEQHGLIDEAIQYALRAETMDKAARLIERHFDLCLRRSERTTVERWLAALPEETVRARPRLSLANAYLTMLGGRIDKIERSLVAAEQAPAEALAEPYEPVAGRGASRLANVPAAIAFNRGLLAHLRGDAEATESFASQALSMLDDEDWLLGSMARGHLAVAAWLRGRVLEAERALSSCIAEWRVAGERGLASWACQQLAQVQIAQGRPDAAVQTYRAVLAIMQNPGGPEPPASGVAYVGMAQVDYQRGDLDAALDHVIEGIARCRQLAYAPPLAMGLSTLAWIRQASGDPSGALSAMDEAEGVGLGSGVVDLLNPIPAERARLLLAQDAADAAVRWAEERGLGPDDRPTYPREGEYLVLARTLLRRSPEGALPLLGRLRSLALDQQRAGSVITIRALEALALAATGAGGDALRTLADALMLAQPLGYVRVFADEGTMMSALIGGLIVAQRADQAAFYRLSPDYLKRVARAFRQDIATPGVLHPTTRVRAGATSVPGLVEPLSGREREVLQLLATGMPNQEIAAELTVTLNTVKKHVGHIFGKLGVANRTEASARARELGLLL